MLSATLLPDASTRYATLTDTTPTPAPVGAVRVAVQVLASGQRVELARSSTSVVLVPLPADGPYLLELQRQLGKVVLDTSNPLPHLTIGTLRAQMSAAYGRHARRPGVDGPDGQWRRLWGRVYALRASFAEGNHSTATGLSRAFRGGTMGTEPVNMPVPGLPHIPSGVTFQVDTPTVGQVTVLVDLAGALNLSAQIVPPTTAVGDKPMQPVVTSGATRSSFSFAAPTDGLYEVLLFIGPAPLTAFLVPVGRLIFREIREDNRALALPFAERSQQLSPTYLARLAHLIGYEAAAATNQVGLANKAYSAALAVPKQPRPIHLYPQL